MPHRSSVPMQWRLKQNRYTITGTKCSCGKLYMPPRAVCECGGDIKPFIFSGRGEIISHTEVHVSPAGFERNTPYNIALVKLDEGPVVSGVVVDKEISIGQRVRSVFRRFSADGDEGLISYGFKFELVH